jgi:hypothetical protein
MGPKLGIVKPIWLNFGIKKEKGNADKKDMED